MPGDRVGKLLAKLPFSLITDRFSTTVLTGPWKQCCKLVCFEPTVGIVKAWVESFDLRGRCWPGLTVGDACPCCSPAAAGVWREMLS